MPAKTKAQNKKVLSKLKLNRLKELAKKYNLKTTKCKRKVDYVNLLLRSKKLPEIMKDDEFFEKEVKELESIKTELDEVGKDIEETMAKVEAIPEMIDENADELLTKGMNFDMNFDEIEDILEQIRMRYEERNFSGTLEYSDGARELAELKLAELEKHLWTYTILSAQKIIEDCHRADVNTKKAIRLLLSAKTAYKDNDIIDNGKLLEKLQDEAQYLLNEEVKKTKKKLVTREQFVNEIKNLGASVTASEELLHRAREVLDRNDHLRAMEYADEAREMAKEAKEKRINEIKDAIPLTRKVIDEAKQMKVNVKEALKLLKQAEVALKKRDFLLCSELTKRAEQKTYDLQSTQTQKAMELRQRQIETIARTIKSLEPIVQNGEAYGVNVSEAKDLLNRAKLALEARDYVNGSLYAANADKIINELKPEIERTKKQLKVSKPESGICSKCKSTYLQFYDNGWGKCISCGNIFKWISEVPDKDKKGLFGWLKK